MARLLGRHARLLCRTSAQAPAPAAVASVRLPVPVPVAVAGPAALTRPKGCQWVAERFMCDDKALAKKNNVPPPFLNGDTFSKATTPEQVLQMWTKHRGNGNQAAKALIKWSHLVTKTMGKFRDQHPELMQDPRLQNILATVSKDILSVRNNTLVTLLRALWVMSLPPNDPLLSSVHTEVLWRTRRMTYKRLAQLVDWGACRKAPEDVNLLNIVLKQLELRWTEISDTKTVIVLISKGDCMSPTLVDRLEDKVLELAESFTAEEIQKVCISLAILKRRSVPLLRALSYYLLQKPSSQFTTPLILDMAFAYGKLNFNHTQVFQRMASELLPRVPELPATDVTRCAKSLGFLKWLHIPLFEAFAEHYITNSQRYSVFQLSNLLMTFARVNFQPSKREEFYSRVHSELDKSLHSLAALLKTDVVWSLCVLQQAKPQQLTALLQQSHITELSSGLPAQLESYHLKIRHIAATLYLEHPDSSDTPTSLSGLSDQAWSSSTTPLQSSLKEALQSLVGGRTEALRTEVHTVYGWKIDGELVVDCENKPIDLSVLKAPHLFSGGAEGQDLPAGARRLAFLAWEYPNFTSKSKDLLGRFILMKRHLQLAGFLTVEVPYFEWLELKSDWHKSEYLKDKLGKAVAEDMAK